MGDCIPPGMLAAELVRKRKGGGYNVNLAPSSSALPVREERVTRRRSLPDMAKLCKYLRIQGPEKETRDQISLFCQTVAH